MHTFYNVSFDLQYNTIVISVYLMLKKNLGCKKVRGQLEATLQTGRRDQKV